MFKSFHNTSPLAIIAICHMMLAASPLTDAFAFSPSSRSILTTSTPSTTNNIRTQYTPLYAEEKDEDEKETEEEETPAGSGGGDATDILSSPAFLKRKLEVLKSDIEAVEEKTEAANEVYLKNKEEWGPQLDDLRKEYATIQDRFTNLNKQGTDLATIDVARKFLEVLDNFDRAFAAVTPTTSTEESIESTYKKTYDEILSVFDELGIEEVETVGAEFDYEVHQAIMMKPSEDYEEGIVCEEMAKGFRMKGEEGKLIRAAMVVVAA